MKVAYSQAEIEQVGDCFELAHGVLDQASVVQGRYLSQPEFLRKSHSPVCPACLVDDGFAQSAWSHVVVTACPNHRAALLSHCPQCDQSIGLGRPELMRCECGFDFRRAARTHAAEFAIGLSALIADVPSITRETLPDPLNERAFEPLLPSFLVMLAKHQGLRTGVFRAKFRFGGASSVEDSAALVSSLESILGEWPRRFDIIMIEQLTNGGGVGLSMRIGVWFRALFSTYRGASFNFVRDRLTALVAEHFDGRLSISNRALMFGANNTESLQWFSASEAARLLGVAPDIFSSLVINQKVTGRVHQEGNSRFVAVHRKTVDELTRQRASYLSATEARQKLGVSKIFFERYIQAGGLRRYKPAERPILVAGEFLVSEIDAVIAAMAGRVRKKPKVTERIGIQDISAKHGISNSKIISILQDILQGTICPTAHLASLPGLAGFLFDKTEIEQRVRDNDPDMPLSVDHLAQVSGWKSSVIKKWIQGGYLRAVQERHGKTQRDVVPLSALIQFLLTYTPTSELSKELGTKTNYLLQSLRPARIECVVPPQEAGGMQRGLLLRTTDLVQGAQLRRTFGDVADRWRAGSCTAVEGVRRQAR